MFCQSIRECLIFTILQLTNFTLLAMKSGIRRSEHVGLGDSIFSELDDYGHHPTPGSGNSDVGNQLECLSFLHPRHRARFVVTSKFAYSNFVIRSLLSLRCKWDTLTPVSITSLHVYAALLHDISKRSCEGAGR